MRRLALLLALAPLGACSMDPHYVRPELPVPPSWLTVWFFGCRIRPIF